MAAFKEPWELWGVGWGGGAGRLCSKTRLISAAQTGAHTFSLRLSRPPVIFFWKSFRPCRPIVSSFPRRHRLSAFIREDRCRRRQSLHPLVSPLRPQHSVFLPSHPFRGTAVIRNHYTRLFFFCFKTIAAMSLGHARHPKHTGAA